MSPGIPAQDSSERQPRERVLTADVYLVVGWTLFALVKVAVAAGPGSLEAAGSIRGVDVCDRQRVADLQAGRGIVGARQSLGGAGTGRGVEHTGVSCVAAKRRFEVLIPILDPRVGVTKGQPKRRNRNLIPTAFRVVW